MDEIVERTQWDFFWVPEDVAVVDRPEIAYLHSPRHGLLYNAVTRTRATPERVGELVQEVTGVHAGVRSRWLVPDTIPSEELERALDDAGYTPVQRHHTCTIAVDAYRPKPAQDIVVHPVDSTQRLRDSWSVMAQAFGRPNDRSEADLVQELEECSKPGARVQRFVAYDEPSGEPISAGGVNVYPTLRFGFLWAGGTIPEARGRGAYSALLKARTIRARELGATHVGLYAVVDTSAPIVMRQGFEKHGSMTYWDRHPSGA